MIAYNLLIDMQNYAIITRLLSAIIDTQQIIVFMAYVVTPFKLTIKLSIIGITTQL
jgi:hypothetical protein